MVKFMSSSQWNAPMSPCVPAFCLLAEMVREGSCASVPLSSHDLKASGIGRALHGAQVADASDIESNRESPLLSKP